MFHFIVNLCYFSLVLLVESLGPCRTVLHASTFWDKTNDASEFSFDSQDSFYNRKNVSHGSQRKKKN